MNHISNLGKVHSQVCRTHFRHFQWSNRGAGHATREKKNTTWNNMEQQIFGHAKLRSDAMMKHDTPWAKAWNCFQSSKQLHRTHVLIFRISCCFSTFTIVTTRASGELEVRFLNVDAILRSSTYIYIYQLCCICWMVLAGVPFLVLPYKKVDFAQSRFTWLPWVLWMVIQIPHNTINLYYHCLSILIVWN